MKLALIAVFLALPLVVFAQSAPRDASPLVGVTVFTTAGAAVQAPTSGVFSFGVAKTVGDRDVFLDLSFSPNTAKSPTKILLAGMTQNLPLGAKFSIKKKQFNIAPYAIVAFGSTLQYAPQLVVAGAKALNSGGVINANPAFTQNYGMAFKVTSVHGLDFSMGAKVNKTNGAQAYPYPFVLISKTF